MNEKEYINQFSTRYSSKEMQYLFSEYNRIKKFRELWICLAETEKELGCEEITEQQINELKANCDDINFDVAHEREKIVKHDVMAHIYAYGKQCPNAAGIIHLGATSCYVTDNADLLIYKEALSLLINKIGGLMVNLSNFAKKYKSLPTLGFTHIQPAQLVTVGKRAVLWLQDLELDYIKLTNLYNFLPFRGAKGTTGTQGSFLELFSGNKEKVIELDKIVAKKMGFKNLIKVSGQTYTRKIDYDITSSLSSLAQSASKFAYDIRLLQSKKEIEEGFSSKQIGSSAMPYKRNPMKSERLDALSRYLISLPLNQSMTAATQMFERTLDDSANRRISMAEAFLCADSIVELYHNIVIGLQVNKNVIKQNVSKELPFMATEAILMTAVNNGADRQIAHEKLRTHAIEAHKRVVEQGKNNDYIERIKKDKYFSNVMNSFNELLVPENYYGLSVFQVENYLKSINKILKKYKNYTFTNDIKI
ncbi:MAG: adenylosuccinate lyase [Clostridia bacterium]|nr:adenylosuccinate lyase [Clostridia bacterium]